MTRDQLIDYLGTVLAAAYEGPPEYGPPEGPRPEGTFVGAARGPLAGLRLVAPDGTTFFLAVLDESAFEQGEG